MHLALGKEGLDPILLNQAAWSLILWKTLSLTLLGILSFLLGLLARTMLVPLLFLVPQIYNLGNYLAAHTSWGAYLPQPAVELFAANANFPICQQSLARTLDNKRMVASHRRHGLSALFEDGFRRTLLMIKALLKK